MTAGVWRVLVIAALAGTVVVPSGAAPLGSEPVEFPLFSHFTGTPTPAMVGYSPSELDPRFDANHSRLTTDSIRADLKALRPVFDGLVLYGYHEKSTPRVVAVAKELKFRGLLLGIWDPKSPREVEGVASLVRQFRNDFALGVVIGNEGLTFHRYEAKDLARAAQQLRSKISRMIPLTTSEPLSGYTSAFVREFGDFLAPNIHPVWDRPDLPPPEAAKWVREQAARLARESQKPVLVKETGFPHGGKEGFTPQTQKAFWEAYLAPGVVARLPELPGIWVFHGVAFEAFDLPWKAEATNMLMERSWGLFSTGRQGYPAFSAWRKALDRYTR